MSEDMCYDIAKNKLRSERVERKSRELSGLMKVMEVLEIELADVAGEIERLKALDLDCVCLDPARDCFGEAL